MELSFIFHLNVTFKLSLNKHTQHKSMIGYINTAYVTKYHLNAIKSRTVNIYLSNMCRSSFRNLDVSSR